MGGNTNGQPPPGIFPVNAYLPFLRSAFFIANSRWSGNDSRSLGSASAVPSSRPLQWRNITADKTSPANSARMSVNVRARTTTRVLLLNPGAAAGQTTEVINERSAHREQLPVLIVRFALNATTWQRHSCHCVTANTARRSNCCFHTSRPDSSRPLSYDCMHSSAAHDVF